MKIAVIGSGGREHALAWRLASEDEHHQVALYPGRAGVPGSTGIGWQDAEALAERFVRDNVDLVVIGPEAPLAAGHADIYRARGLQVLGAGAEAAKLEGSKAYAKDFMRRHGVRTARAEVVRGLAALRGCLSAWDGGVVLKYDGLAEGKGVWVCATPAEREEAMREIDARFDASSVFVVEQLLRGREVSCIGLTDGKFLLMLPPSQDHKRLLDGDQGPNTGGMGAYSPVRWFADADRQVAWREILAPTLRGLAADQIAYRGVIYFGLMICADGPYLLEYNARFGDPETQPLMQVTAGKLSEDFIRVARGELVQDEWRRTNFMQAFTVVLASADYPGPNQHPVAMRFAAEHIEGFREGVRCFVAGAQQGSDGQWVASGGRVLGVTGYDYDDPHHIGTAREKAYESIDDFAFPGAQWRRDIGRHARLTRVAVLCSGRGSNFEAIAKAAQEGILAPLCQIALAIVNVSGAGALDVAASYGISAEEIPHAGMSRAEHETKVLEALEQHEIELVVLAGYMRVLSPAFIAKFPGRIVNIHPADTRAHQGLHGYQWAFDSQLEQTHVTVHKVDAGLDTGAVLMQRAVNLAGVQTVEDVVARGLLVEHQLYPQALRKLLLEEF